jgi:hypothetical protein
MKRKPKRKATDRLSLAPLTPEQALHIALNTAIPKASKKATKRPKP